MIYIRISGDYVTLGGEAATEEMLSEQGGYTEYHGAIPKLSPFGIMKIREGVLYEEIQQKLKDEYNKVQKNIELKKIKVTTTSNNTFDGNETARSNMASAIIHMETNTINDIQWKLADNTIVSITLAELKEALSLAIQKVGELVTTVDFPYIDPYSNTALPI